MYYISKTFEFSAAHRLVLDYESPCSRLHGHNWRVTVECRSRELNANGMVVDFSEIKRRVIDVVDHKMLNEVFDFNPTAENLARWIADSIPHCHRVEVEESLNNRAIYERDE